MNTANNEKTDWIGRNIHHSTIDYRMEVVAAALIGQGYSLDELRIIRQGMARRGFSTDVEAVYWQYAPKEQQDYLCIETNREGLYDMLPEGVFHQPIGKQLNPDKDDVLQEIRAHRQQEFFARRFFQFFEEQADKTMVEAYLFESRYNRMLNYPDFVDLFVPYWPFIKHLPHKQAVFFIHTIPILHQIRVNAERVGEALSLILDVPIVLQPISLSDKKATHSFESRLGESRLGVDLVLGNTFDDGEDDLQLLIGPLPAQRMRNFLETGSEYQLLEELCQVFLPADLFVVYEFLIDPEDSAFILSDETHTTYLGINSFL